MERMVLHITMLESEIRKQEGLRELSEYLLKYNNPHWWKFVILAIMLNANFALELSFPFIRNYRKVF